MAEGRGGTGVGAVCGGGDALGFATLRNTCGMNCGVRVKMREISPALQADISRVTELWNDGLQKFGGPFLAGKDFTNAERCSVRWRIACSRYRTPDRPKVGGLCADAA